MLCWYYYVMLCGIVFWLCQSPHAIADLQISANLLFTIKSLKYYVHIRLVNLIWIEFTVNHFNSNFVCNHCLCATRTMLTLCNFLQKVLIKLTTSASFRRKKEMFQRRIALVIVITFMSQNWKLKINRNQKYQSCWQWSATGWRIIMNWTELCAVGIVSF